MPPQRRTVSLENSAPKNSISFLECLSCYRYDCVASSRLLEMPNAKKSPDRKHTDCSGSVPKFPASTFARESIIMLICNLELQFVITFFSNICVSSYRTKCRMIDPCLRPLDGSRGVWRCQARSMALLRINLIWKNQHEKWSSFTATKLKVDGKIESARTPRRFHHLFFTIELFILFFIMFF